MRSSLSLCCCSCSRTGRQRSPGGLSTSLLCSWTQNGNKDSETELGDQFAKILGRLNKSEKEEGDKGRD